jgi:hypothetical protein
MAEFSNLVAAICPDVFCQPASRGKVKRLLRDSLAAANHLAYQHAAAQAKPVEVNAVALERLMETNPFDYPGHRSPVEQHTLELENVAEPVEPFYFQLLDQLQNQEGWRVTKLVDTVTSTNGPGFSTDLTARVTQQQHQAAEQMLRMQHQVRTLLQQWQKWKDLREQLRAYDAASEKNGPDRETAEWALHLRWRRLIEAAPEGHRTNTDTEFRRWRKQSETDLRRLVEIDRRLLAQQLNFLKLQAGWLRPYLQTSVAPTGKNDPSLVNAFNTALFEVLLLVELPSGIDVRVQKGELPKMLSNRKHQRAAPVLLIELRFRAIPERAKAGHYGYRGRVTMTFTSYALREDELRVLVRELQRSDWGEVLGIVEADLAGNLSALLNDLDELLVEPDTTAVSSGKPESPSTNANPFTALFDFSNWRAAETEQHNYVGKEPLRADTETEAVLRTLALLEARESCLELYHRSKELFTVTHHRV